LKETFLKIDTNQDGSLSLEELRIGVKNICLFEILQNHNDTEGHDEDCYIHIMEMCDTDGDGKIDYLEFIQAAIDH
jgi:Ca2+-binding EF-hand superfamily protein